MNKKPWQFLVIICLPLLFIILGSQSSIFRSYENSFYDLAFKLRKQQPQSKDIALIKIDDATLQYLGQWPLPRDYHAVLLDILKEFEAKAVFFDIIFSEPSTYDLPFSESLQNAGNAYLPIVFYLNPKSRSSNLLIEPNAVLAPLAPTISGHHHLGHINTIIDSDGKIRRTLLYIRDQETLRPQLSLQVACDVLELDCSQVQSTVNEVIIDRSLRIPVADFNEILVNYPDHWENSFEHFSYLNILKLYDAYKHDGADPGILKRLKGKICFIGLTATGTVDLRANPIENNYPMLGLNASLFNSLIHQQFIHPVSRRDRTFISAIIFLLSLWLCLKFKPLTSFLGNIILGVAYLITAIFMFSHFSVWIPMFLPLLIIVLVYIIAASLRLLKEEKQRQMLEKELVIASDIQNQFLISIDKAFEDFDVAVWFKPAKFIAGDLYDIFEIDENRSGIFIGDVSGKGLPAALLMAQAISLFRIFSRQLNEPYAVLTDLNQALAERSAGRFVTALYCIVNRTTKKLQLASAGHEPLYIYRKNKGRLDEVNIPPNYPLGIMEDTEYRNIYTSVDVGDQIVLVSDGVMEAKNEKDQEFGNARVKAIIEQNAGKSAKELLGCIKIGLLKFTKAEDQFDDITIIVLSI